MNHYQTLGIPKCSSGAVIRTAYTKLVRRVHPDKTNGNTQDEAGRVNEAYRILKDPDLKRQYDLSLGIAVPALVSSYKNMFRNMAQKLFKEAEEQRMQEAAMKNKAKRKKKTVNNGKIEKHKENPGRESMRNLKRFTKSTAQAPKNNVQAPKSAPKKRKNEVPAHSSKSDKKTRLSDKEEESLEQRLRDEIEAKYEALYQKAMQQELTDQSMWNAILQIRKDDVHYLKEEVQKLKKEQTEPSSNLKKKKNTTV